MGFIFLEMIVIVAVLLVSLKLLLNEQHGEETYKVGSFCPVNRSSLKGQRVSWF